MARLLGTDVSRWQGKLDWGKLAGVPVGGLPLTFAVAKATNGLSVDEEFKANATSMAAHLKWWGFYHWLVPTQDPIAQADFFVQQLKSVGVGTLPPTVDFEDDSHGRVTGQALIDVMHAFIDRVGEKTNLRAIIYTGKWFWAGACKDLDADWASSHALWHAEYPKVTSIPMPSALPLSHLPKPWASRGIYETFWQFDGDGGLVLPTGRDADFDLFDGTEEDLQNFVENGPKTYSPLPLGMPDFTSLKAIQTELITQGFDLGPSGADGIRGPATTLAIKKFQATRGLTADGIIGPLTRTALASAWAHRTAG